MENPFQNIGYQDLTDHQLVAESLNGSKQALEQLIQKHQHFIYNVAHKMVCSSFDAEDITQEVLIKVITKLSQFQGKSSFRTWLYRIVFNHVLQMKKYCLEEVVTTFETYGEELDKMPNHELSEHEQLEMKELIEEAKLGCMAGMLLCLNREQRLVYILGEIFEIEHQLGAEMLEISPDNFRQRLSRARKDLYQFMNNKCGLVNQNNPCRCQKKTKGFIEAGWVDEKQMKFNTSFTKKISQTLISKSDELCDMLENQYADLFQKHPFQEKTHLEKLMRGILEDRNLKQLFNLN
jgi:RNA polymerase sigma factor (sigma-70 family)